MSVKRQLRGYRTVVLFTSDALDVNDPLLSVNGGDLAIAILEGATNNLNLIILTDGHGADLDWKRVALMTNTPNSSVLAYVVLGTQLLAERSAHHYAARLRVGREVGLALLAASRRHSCFEQPQTHVGH